MKKFVYGIDLGTANSCIAYVDENGIPTIIKNAEGNTTTPSVVDFPDLQSVVVGETAKANRVISPDTTVQYVKLLMGQKDVAIEVHGEMKSPVEISSYIIKKLAEDAQRNLNAEVKDVVITCPAYFDMPRRAATRQAAEIAGLNVLEILNEPTAAAIYYGVTKGEEEKTILVYDLGGGTFDVTVMRVAPGVVEEICADGDHQRGGKDWDAQLFEYLRKQFVEETGFSGELDSFAIQHLTEVTEKTKEMLSSRETAIAGISVDGSRARIEVTRDTFNEITSSLLAQTVEVTKKMIELAAEKNHIVEEIHLVGGSTRMPQVEAALLHNFSLPIHVLDPDEAVAKGAAIHAVNLYLYKQEDQLDEIESGETIEEEKILPEIDIKGGRLGEGRRMEISTVTTKSFGLEVMAANDERKCNNMILKNEPMPDKQISVTEVFNTYSDNQSNVELIVFENNSMERYIDPDEDLVLGTAILNLLPNTPKSSPIEITFTLDNQGILFITAIDKRSGNILETEMKSSMIMTEKEVEELAAKTGLTKLQDY